MDNDNPGGGQPVDNSSSHSGNVVVGAFSSEANAQQAVTALQQAGFDAGSVGVVARDQTTLVGVDPSENNVAGEAAGIGATAGGLLGALGGLLIGVGALAIPGVGPIIAGGVVANALASAAAGAAIGAATGGVSGALVGLGIPNEEADYFNARFEAGDIILTVDAGDRAAEASTILGNAGASRITDAGNPAA